MKRPIILLASLFLFINTIAQRTWDGPATGGSWAVAANWTGNVVPATNEVVIFPTGMNGTISNVNGGNNITLGGLIIQGNSKITFTNSSNRTITISNGTATNDLVVEAAASMTLGTNINLTLASGTTTNNTRASIAGTLVVGDNRTFDTNNGNVLTTVTGTLRNEGTIAGHANRLSFSGGSVYIHDREAGSIPAATWNVTSTCRLVGLTDADPTNDNQEFGNLVYDCPAMTGNRELGGSGLVIAGNLQIINTGTAILRQGPSEITVHGNFEMSGGTFRIGDNSNRTLQVRADFSMTGGQMQMSTGNNVNDRGTMNVSGNFSQTGGVITETFNGRGVINFAGNSSQTFYKTAGGTISNNIDFAISNGASVDFGTSILDGSSGNFTLNAGGKIITANNNGFNGTGPNNGTIRVTGTKQYSSLADYEFKGTSTGVFTTTTNPQVRNLTVNNNSGNVTLAQPITVNGVLTLTAGALTTTTTNLLTLGITGSTTVATNTSFVNGPLAKMFGFPLTAFTFPVGKAGAGFRNIAITAPSAASTFRAEFFRGAPPAGTLGAGITQISACEYWDLTRTAGAASVSTRVILSWEPGSSCNAAPYVTDQTTLRVAHLAGGVWNSEGFLATTGSTGAGTVTSGNLINTFSPFVLASSGPAENPLPVRFTNVKAIRGTNGIRIEWANLSEKDITTYIVERSGNGRDFTAIAEQLPSGNNNEKSEYEITDPSSLTGKTWYRVKAVERSGHSFYSMVLTVDPTADITKLLLYPNPVKGTTMTLHVTGIRPGKFDVRVVNMSGYAIHQVTLTSIGSNLSQVLELPANTSAGVYNLVISGPGFRSNQVFFVERN